jgi:hypothetical protein
MNTHNPQFSTKTARRRRKRASSYDYYLQDHPFLGPLVTLLLGSLCIYSTVFSNLLRDLLIPRGDRTTLDNFYTFMGWGVAFVFAIMIITIIFLGLNIVDAVLQRARRKPIVCAGCGLTEIPRSIEFAREPVEDTDDLDKITCPHCGHFWFMRG